MTIIRFIVKESELDDMTISTNNKRHYVNLIIVAILTGVLISAYKLAISFVSQNMQAILALCRKQSSGLVLFIIALLSLAFCVQKLCQVDFFATSGSGIPIIYGLINNNWSVKWQKALPIRFITSSLTVGSGLTLGREGPSVQLGGLIADAVTKVRTCQNETDKNECIMAGSAAALAVAFNTPLAGIAFYIEELAHKLSKRTLIAACLTVLIAVFTGNLIIENKPTLANINQFAPVQLKDYLLVAGLAVMTGCSGVLFSYLILNSNKFYSLIKLKDTYKYYLPFIVAAIFLYFDPRLFGVGEDMMEIDFAHTGNISLLIYFYLAKLLLLFLAFGIKVPGGNLVPLLVIGALVGNIYASVLLNLGLIQANQVYFFVLLALCAHFSAIVRTPITAIILVFEMSGAAFSYLFSLVLVSFIAYIIAEYVHVPAFYEDLYAKMLVKQSN